MSSISLIALALCCAWASGVNVYAVLLVLGLSAEFNYLALPSGLEFLADPLFILLFGFMYCVEFIADKIPGIDSAWDVLHTFIRIPAAAFLVGGFMEDDYPQWQEIAQVIAVLLAFFSHLTKASSRLLINTSPEPFSNWAASVSEDVLVFVALWLAFAHPVAFCILLLGIVALMIWLLPKTFRLIASILVRLRNWLSAASRTV